MTFFPNPDNVRRNDAIKDLLEARWTRPAIAKKLGLTKSIVDGVAYRWTHERVGRNKPKHISAGTRRAARKGLSDGMSLAEVSRLLKLNPGRLDRSLWKYMGERL